MAQAKRDAQPNAEGASSIPGHRYVVTETNRYVVTETNRYVVTRRGATERGTGARQRGYRGGVTRSANATRLSS